MRPLVSSIVLYVDLLVSTSTATTTPSSAGMSADTRTSCDSPQACVTEATLSTTILRIPLVIPMAMFMRPLRVRPHVVQTRRSARQSWRNPGHPLESTLPPLRRTRPSTRPSASRVTQHLQQRDFPAETTREHRRSRAPATTRAALRYRGTLDPEAGLRAPGRHRAVQPTP